jgi:hypothetical protein
VVTFGIVTSGTLTTFTVASNEFIGGGKEKSEYQVKGKVSAFRLAGEKLSLSDHLHSGVAPVEKTSRWTLDVVAVRLNHSIV